LVDGVFNCHKCVRIISRIVQVASNLDASTSNNGCVLLQVSYKRFKNITRSAALKNKYEFWSSLAIPSVVKQLVVVQINPTIVKTNSSDRTIVLILNESNFKLLISANLSRTF
jgi:hypothetical protein